jgi:anti-sigma B factor antagonist
MEITESKRNGVVILGVQGRLDASNAGVLEEKILGLIAADEKRFVVDCTQLDYISSAGLRVLLVAAKRLTAVSGKISLCSLKEHIKEVFDIAGFSSIFSVYPMLDEAVASVALATGA